MTDANGPEVAPTVPPEAGDRPTHLGRLWRYGRWGRLGRRTRLAAAAGVVLAAAAGVFAAFYLGRGEPRVDASSADALTRSLARINARLDPAHRQQFAGDCMAVGYPHAVALAFTGQDPADPTVFFRPLDGLTAAEVHEAAEAARAKARAGSGGAAKPAAPLPEADPAWTPAGTPARVGDVQVDLVSASVGPVGLRDGTSSGDALAVRVRVANLNPNRKLDYSSWQGGLFGEGHATAGDNFGNRYKHIDYSFGSRPRGNVSLESVYPDKPVEDLLTFEAPLAAVEYLIVDLPAKRFGGEGVVRFRVPAAAIVGLKAYKGDRAETPAPRVTAGELAAAYQADSFAAAAKYRNLVAVTGRVTKVESDLYRAVILTLDTGGLGRGHYVTCSCSEAVGRTCGGVGQTVTVTGQCFLNTQDVRVYADAVAVGSP